MRESASSVISGATQLAIAARPEKACQGKDREERDSPGIVTTVGSMVIQQNIAGRSQGKEKGWSKGKGGGKQQWSKGKGKG